LVSYEIAHVACCSHLRHKWSIVLGLGLGVGALSFNRVPTRKLIILYVAYESIPLNCSIT